MLLDFEPASIEHTMNLHHDPASASFAAASGVDVLSEVLRNVRLTGSMLLLVDAHSPWMSWAPKTEAFHADVLPASQHLISFHVLTQGRRWAGLHGAPPERFDAGDVMIVPHGDAYGLAEPPGTEASYGQAEAVAFFRHMAAGVLPSIVREGGEGALSTQFICGFLGCDRTPCNPVLDALPPMVHLRASGTAPDRLQHLVEFALCELREPSSGSEGVRLRLAELMFIEVVRRHLHTVAEAPAGWLAGLHDPLVARALSLLHGAPARRWTLAGLASQAGSSRSVLAGRFAQFVGQPPMQYLALWRMQLATRLLVEPGAGKVAAVTEAVGYESEAAFSRAFKKCVGVAPAVWRLRQAVAPRDIGGVGTRTVGRRGGVGGRKPAGRKPA